MSLPRCSGQPTKNKGKTRIQLIKLYRSRSRAMIGRSTWLAISHYLTGFASHSSCQSSLVDSRNALPPGCRWPSQGRCDNICFAVTISFSDRNRQTAIKWHRPTTTCLTSGRSRIHSVLPRRTISKK